MQETLSMPMSKSNELPALSDNTFMRYFNFIALYIAQGIPEGMAFFGIPAWMAMNHKTPGEIGTFVAMVGLPWSLKIIVAPLMDRFTYLPMGRRRPWVLFGQLGLITAFIVMAFVPDPLNNMKLFYAAGFTVGFFGAFQDVATDGMAIDIIPVEQQARANGFMWGAKIIGTSASLALGSYLLNKYGYTTSILMLSIMVCLIMLAPLLLRERPGERLLPWTTGNVSKEAEQMRVTSWKVIFKSLSKVFLLRNSLLFAVVIFIGAAAFNYTDTIISIFTIQALGWTNQAYSQYYATATLVGGIGGMLIGGILIEKFGKIKMLNIYFGLLVVLISLFTFLKNFWMHTSFIVGFMVAYQILYVFSNIGMLALAMQCCWKKVSASQFTLYMTIYNLGRIAGAKLIGPVKENFEWEQTIFATVFMLLFSWLVLQFTMISKHEKSVAEIDAEDLMAKAPAFL